MAATTTQARRVTCPRCGARPGAKCVYVLPAESPWAADNGKPMHSGAHAERFTA